MKVNNFFLDLCQCLYVSGMGEHHSYKFTLFDIVLEMEEILSTASYLMSFSGIYEPRPLCPALTGSTKVHEFKLRAEFHII